MYYNNKEIYKGEMKDKKWKEMVKYYLKMETNI